jgi:hypothetical protein
MADVHSDDELVSAAGVPDGPAPTPSRLPSLPRINSGYARIDAGRCDSPASSAPVAAASPRVAPSCADTPLSVFCGTWNMHYARPPPQLQPWLDIGRHDLYAISTQEADRHLAVAVVLPAKPRWEAALRRAFGIDGDGDDGASGYTWLGSRALGGSHVALLVRTALVPSITRLRRGGVPAGLLGGLLGNKGGVALELTLGRSTLLFVGVHLAAHTGRAAVEARDSQLLSIFARLPAALSRGGGGGGGEAAAFLLGDLNYRVTLPPQQARDLLAPPSAAALASSGRSAAEHHAAALTRLLAADPLVARPAAQRAPEELRFVEASITFPPTYKLDKRARYARYVFEKRRKPPAAWVFGQTKPRTPSWTDRVLHRAAADGVVAQQSYEAIDDPAFAISDHRPVAATFTVAVDLDTAAAAEAARRQPRPRLLALSAALRSALSRSAPHLLLFGRCPATLEVAALAGLSAALLLHPALLSLRATAVRWTPLWWLAASASGLGVGLLAPIGLVAAVSPDAEANAAWRASVRYKAGAV